MSLAEVLMASPEITADELPAEVAAGGISPVLVVTPASSLLVLDLTVLSAEGTIAGELTPAEVTIGLLRPPVAVVKATARRSAASIALGFIDSPAASTSDCDPATEVAAGGVPVPSDDELDWSASTSWVVWDCTCVSICCPVLGSVCEPKVLRPWPPALETDVSDAMLPEVRCPILAVSSRSSASFKSAPLEEGALDSGCAVDPTWEEVTLLAGCTTVDESVACVKALFPLS